MAITKKQIAKWNKEFNKLSKAEKRAAVAKDVLQQISKDKYIPANYGYVNLNIEGDIQNQFDKIKHCKVCNLGSCVLSLTKFVNNLEQKDVEDCGETFQNPDSKVSKLLKTVFTPYQQALIEAAFESGQYSHAAEAYDVRLSDIDEDKCINFYNKFSNAKERQIATMKNIIANQGTFKP